MRPSDARPIVFFSAWPARHHLIDQPKLPCLIWAHEPVTLNRSLDHVERLVGVLYIYGIQASPQRKDLARLDFDVGGLPLSAPDG